MAGQDSLNTRRTLTVDGQEYDYFSIPEAEANGLGDVSRLPFSLKVLLENLLRYEDGRTVVTDDAKAMSQWVTDRKSDREIAYRPARVLMQDFTGVPAVVDLAAMRDDVELAAILHDLGQLDRDEVRRYEIARTNRDELRKLRGEA